MTPAWSQTHAAPRLHTPKKMKLPRHRGCWCKGPRHGVRTGKDEPFNVQITAWGHEVASFNCRHKRWWEPKLPCGSQTPLLDGDGMLAGNKLNSGRELGTTSYLLFKTLAWHHLTGVSNAFQNNRGLELYPNFRNKLFLPSLLNTITVFSKPWNPVSFSRQKSQDLCTSILNKVG